MFEDVTLIEPLGSRPYYTQVEFPIYSRHGDLDRGDLFMCRVSHTFSIHIHVLGDMVTQVEFSTDDWRQDTSSLDYKLGRGCHALTRERFMVAWVKAHEMLSRVPSVEPAAGDVESPAEEISGELHAAAKLEKCFPTMDTPQTMAQLVDVLCEHGTDIVTVLWVWAEETRSSFQAPGTSHFYFPDERTGELMTRLGFLQPWETWST